MLPEPIHDMIRVHTSFVQVLGRVRENFIPGFVHAPCSHAPRHTSTGVNRHAPRPMGWNHKRLNVVNTCEIVVGINLSSEVVKTSIHIPSYEFWRVTAA